MRAAVRREALAMLRRLRKVAAVELGACLSDVRGDGPDDEVGDVAYDALVNAGFYERLTRPAMVRAVDRAIAAVRKSGAKP